MFDRPGPRLFRLPFGTDFAPALIQGLEERLRGAPPEAWARVTIYVPTRRMQRRLRETRAVDPPTAVAAPQIGRARQAFGHRHRIGGGPVADVLDGDETARGQPGKAPLGPRDRQARAEGQAGPFGLLHVGGGIDMGGRGRHPMRDRRQVMAQRGASQPAAIAV